MQLRSTLLSRFATGISASAMVLSLAISQAVWAEDEEQQEQAEGADVSTEGEAYGQAADYDPVLEEVKVKGFRSSLQQAVALRRDAVNTRDSIVTEDIGKMPDLNLAEAIQRVPGVAITREGGEGRQISLRGLGPNFTRVTLNGMEVPASTAGLDSSGGTNRGRAFDFNVFSAELFTRIDINKTPTAAIEEGGIAGTVELYSARPLDNPGFQGSVFGQVGYNDLSEKWDPRGTLFLSNTNEDETFGWLVTVAYTERTTYQDGFGTVRWARPDRPFAGNNTGLSDEQLHDLWYPRLPRQDSFHHDQDRLGASAALQWRPNDDLEFGLTWVYSKFNSDTDSYNSFGEFRRSGSWGYPNITPNSVTIDPGGDYAIAGNFDGVGLRTESRKTADETKFNQVVGDMRWNINDSWTLTGMVGTAKSKYFGDYFRVNIENFQPGANLTYDFTENSNVASLDYNFDVTDPDNFFIMNNHRIRQYGVDRDNDTARIDLEWAINDENYLNFGGIYNDRTVESTELRSTTDEVTDIRGLSKVFNYYDAGGYGDATELDFLVLDFAKAIPAYNAVFALAAGRGIQTWKVKEKTKGLYVDYNLVTEWGGHGFRMNLGVRYVDTDTDATGFFNPTTPIEESNDYDNWLPSLNLAFDLTDDVVLRGSVARTMTRASLSSLAPSKAYSDVNFTVSGGNSQLQPLKSDQFDLGIEWYFTEGAVLAFNYFQKDIKSFISSPSTEEPLRLVDYPAVAAIYPTQPELLDPSLIWTYSTPANTDGTDMNGWEIAYQQAFTNLPGAWSGFGFIGNYSYVDATTTVIRSGETVKVPLEGMSKHSWNATLYYEMDRWGARVAVNNRDDYITDNTGSNGNISHGTTGPTQWDFSSFFHINDRWSLTFEIINFTNRSERLFTTGDGDLNLVREYNKTGRQFFLGARFNF